MLDVGCGTGRHLIPLIRRGYRVVGLDARDREEAKTSARRLIFVAVKAT